MDVSRANWLSIMGMEDPSLLYQCQMDHFLHESIPQFSTPNLTSQTINTNFPSFYSTHSSINSSDFDSYTYETAIEKPAKQQKNNHCNSNISQKLAPKSSLSPLSSLISFGNNANPKQQIPSKVFENIINNSGMSKEELDSPTKMNFPYDFGTVEFVEDAQRVNLVRSPIQAKDHVIAERKRREKLNQGFIALSSLLPGLTKLDKASILGVAIQHIKGLQENAKFLEEETIRRHANADTDILHATKSNSSGGDDSSPSVDTIDEIFVGKSNLEVEVRVCDSDVLIQVRCEKQNGIIGNIFGKIEKFNMVIINSNIMPFAHTSLAISIVAQMEGQLSTSAKDLASNLRSALRN